MSVAARLNLDKSTTSEVVYDPNSRVERSVRTVRENALAQNSTTDAAATVEQNLPTAQQNVGEAGKNSNETNDRREELTNYEVSTRTTEVSHKGYKIEHLSIAVLVNQHRLTALADTSQDAPPIDYQLMDIEQLVGAAAGFSKDRGDQLKVAAVAFADDAPEEIAPPGMLDVLMAQMGSYVNSLALIVIAIVTILFGLRPAVRAILAQSATAPAPMAAEAIGQAQAQAIPGAAAAQSLDDPHLNLIEDVTNRMNRSPQKRLEQIVEYDEAQAAAILRQWLHQDEAA